MFLYYVRKEGKECRIMEEKKGGIYLLLLKLVGWYLCETTMVVLFDMLIWNQIPCWLVVIG